MMSRLCGAVLLALAVLSVPSAARAISPEDFNASGSVLATTGAISAGSTSLVLADLMDFKNPQGANAQGILVCGAGAAGTAATPTGLTVSAQGTGGTTTYAYQIASDDGNGGLSAATSAASTAAGNATLNNTNFNHLSWTAGSGAKRYHIWRSVSGGAYTYIGSTYLISFNDVGLAGLGLSNGQPFWVPATPNNAAQADFFVSNVRAGAGTHILTLGNAATTTAPTGACVRHDDTVALQAAINAAQTSINCCFGYPPSSNLPDYYIPGVRLAPGGFYNLSSALSATSATMGLSAQAKATLQMAGYGATILTTSAMNRLTIENVTFAGGAHHLSMTQANIDNTLYNLWNVEFNTSSDYAIVTSGDYSAALHCYACNFVNLNGAISSDADGLDIQGGWSEPIYYTFQSNRAWFKQSHMVSATNASFTGSISGTTLTLSSSTPGLAVGQFVAGTGVSNNTFLVSQTDSTHWVVSLSQSVGSEPMTSYTPYYNQIWGVANHFGVSATDDFTLPSPNYVAGARWFDVQGTLQSNGNRWGGESSGIPIVMSRARFRQ